MGSVRQRRDPVVAAIALGSNLGDREAHLAAALRALEKASDIVVLRRSSWVETDPVGGPAGQGPYLNGAALVETRLHAGELLDELLRIEEKLGRQRVADERNAPRTMDLDLLLYGNETLDTPELTLPHPRMAERRFVLEPLAQLCPERSIPGLERTVAECLEALGESCDSGGLVRLANPEAAREWCAKARAEGLRLGFVPTMGALHEGHIRLVRRALEENDRVCVSVFVNPLQFDEASDFEGYTRDLDGDSEKLAAAGCSMVFTGTLEEFFPEKPADGELPTAVRVDPGPAAAGLEGEHRPGHFEGVATIVDRLFEVVVPHSAYFGRKDYQQTLVVADVARRRGGEPEIVVCPTVREPSGLAMSSRNARLDDGERARALAIPRALAAASAAWQSGERDLERLAAALRRELEASDLEIEYAEIRDPDDWSSAARAAPLARAVALVAARAGKVRLIDNHELGEPFPA